MIDAEWLIEVERGLCALAADAINASPLGIPGAIYDEDGYDGADPALIRLRRVAIPPDDFQHISIRYYDEVPPVPGLDLVEGLFQVRSRTTSNPDAGKRVHGVVFNALHELAGVPLGRARASLIMGGGLAYLGTDTNGRHEYSQNFRVRGSGHVSA